jgi:predicted DNA-binding transcriptional regulator AlpA
MERREKGGVNENLVTRMIGIRELSIYIGLAEQTIRNQLASGTFPIRTKKIGGLLKWDISDVDNYLDNLPKVN